MRNLLLSKPSGPRAVVQGNLLKMVGASLGVGLLTWFYFATLPPLYRASAQLLIEEAAFFRSASAKGTPLDNTAYFQAALSEEVLGQVSLLEGSPALSELRPIAQPVFITDKDKNGIYVLTIRHRDQELAKRLAKAWAEALEQWDDEYVRARFSSYRQNLEAQLTQVTQTFRKLRSELPTSEEPKYTQDLINYMSLVRGNLYKDVQLTRGLEQAAVGFLNPTRQGVTTMVIGVNPRRNGAMAAGITFALLGLLWLWIDRWTTVVAMRQRISQLQTTAPLAQT
jgi:hypothetical protein